MLKVPVKVLIRRKYGSYTWIMEKYDFKGDNYIAKQLRSYQQRILAEVYDSRDNIYDPKRGKRVSATVQWAWPRLRR